MSNWMYCSKCGSLIVDESTPCSSCGELKFYSPPPPTSKLENAKNAIETFFSNKDNDSDAHSNMLVTNILSLPNIKEAHGLVSAYNYWMSEDPKQDDLLIEIETTKKRLIKRLKHQAHEMGCNAIVGFTLDIKIDHSTYLSSGVGVSGVSVGKITVLSGIGINIYGTAVTLDKTTG